jgi:Flp pilus assembly protein TadG
MINGKNIWGALRLLRGSEKGSVITEYAVILPVFLMMILGGFELGHIYMVNAALEGALTQSTRIAMSGILPLGFTDRNAYIEDYVRSSLQSIGVTEGITITMNIYDSFANIGEAEPYVDLNGNQQYESGECYTDINSNGTWDADMGATGAGGEENIMVMRVDVALPFLTGFVKPIVGGRNSIGLSATTAIRNEPFGGVTWVPSDNVICS